MSKTNIGGIPQDGDVYEEDDDQLELELGQPDDDDDSGKPEPKKDPRDEALAALRAEIDGLKSTINTMRPAPAPAPAPKPEPEPDWEDLMFKDPKEYNRLLREHVKKEISGELRGDYQRDQGTRDFWSAFYTDHADLKGDDDIVKAILQANLADLAPMPVKAAGDKLAELTRSRILKYTGGKLPGGKKAVAEGNGQGVPVKKDPEPDKVVTLSQLLRARRAKRNKGTAA